MQQEFISPIIWPENPQFGPIKLRSYQELCTKNVVHNFTHNVSLRQLIVLATGLGKTIQMADIAKWSLTVLKKPVMMIAHREELLEQAKEEFVKVLGDSYKIDHEQAEQWSSLDAHIITASVQTIGRSGSKRIERFQRDHFGVIFIDEAHHSTSDTYLNIINYFKPEETGTLLVGVTATPNRSDKESLSEIFNTVAIKKDIVDGTKEKFLCPIISWRVDSKTDLSSVRTTAGDFNLKDLANAVNNKERNTLIVETYTKRFPDQQALIFATDVEHVYRLQEEFQSIGISAFGVSGDMPKDERRQIISDFKLGKIRILINFGIATEGFNHQPLEVVINARPTQSQLLVTQMLGRVSRLSPETGKTVGHWVEIIDLHSDKTATAASVFKFKKIFDCEGHSLLECLLKAESMSSEKEYFNPFNCDSWSDMLLRFERANQNNPKGFDTSKINNQYFIGGAPRDTKEDIYSTFNPDLEFFTSRYKYFYVGQSLKLLHTDKDEGYRYQIFATPNPIGGYDIQTVRKPLGATLYEPAERVIAYRGVTARDAVKKMEDYILENYSDWDNLLYINAPWKKRAAMQPSSDKQYQIIAKYKLSNLPKEQINKNMASDLISAFFSRR